SRGGTDRTCACAQAWSGGLAQHTRCTPIMDTGGSFLDESLAVGGMMTTLGAFIWALLVMGLAPTP
ncbi:MAG: hypothetical protein KGN30_08400, partial [Nitrospirota bacterium]|nr:hypothetical protein [Nitrospirota bacterium]